MCVAPKFWKNWVTSPQPNLQDISLWRGQNTLTGDNGRVLTQDLSDSRHPGEQKPKETACAEDNQLSVLLGKMDLFDCSAEGLALLHVGRVGEWVMPGTEKNEQWTWWLWWCKRGSSLQPGPCPNGSHVLQTLHWALQEHVRHTSPKDDNKRYYWSWYVGRGWTRISQDLLKLHVPLTAQFTDTKHLQTSVPK